MNNTENKIRALRNIMVAYLSNNYVPILQIDILILDVYAVLSNETTPESGRNKRSATPNRDRNSTDILAQNSIRSNGIVSMIDGRVYKTLKRHLKAHGLTPDTYRQNFGLDKDYPMVAPDYAARRADIARRTGLGRPGFMTGLKSEPQHEDSQPG